MNLKVARSIKQPNGDRIVLYHWALSNDHKNENVACLASDGAIRWRAALPESVDASDCFVSLVAKADVLVAKSFSGFAIDLDPASGRRVSIGSPPDGAIRSPVRRRARSAAR